jgi:alginate O-acetyltransferase complex protein AlgI
MDAYTPTSWTVPAALLGLIVALLALGLLTTRLRPAPGRVLAWALVVSALAAAERLTAAEPPGVRMLGVVLALLVAFKAVVTVEAQAAGMPRLGPWRWLAFAGPWVGMRPALFAAAGGPPRPGALRLAMQSLAFMALGAALLAAARRLYDVHFWAASAVLMVGLGLVLHWGLLALLAAAWRTQGVPAEPLHRAPLRARSLGEFWGRRWNLAFSEMTAVAVFRPLRGRVGAAAAVLASFALSGLLHEAAISVPVRAGYGAPLAYFLLHGLLVLVERRLDGTPWAVERWGAWGRAWTAAWVVLPAPVLFHEPFLRGCAWPLVGVYG